MGSEQGLLALRSKSAGHEPAGDRLGELAGAHGAQPVPGVARRVGEVPQLEALSTRARVRHGVERAELAGSSGSQSGISANGSTPCSSSSCSLTQVTSGLEAVPVLQASISSPNDDGGPHTLKTPVASRSVWATVKAPRSRPSTSWTGASGEPGASTSPARARRSTHHVKRFVGS